MNNLLKKEKDCLKKGSLEDPNNMIKCMHCSSSCQDQYPAELEQHIRRRFFAL